MCLISVPNFKKSIQEKDVFFWLKIIVLSRCEEEEEEYEENQAIFKNAYFKNYLADFPQL